MPNELGRRIHEHSDKFKQREDIKENLPKNNVKLKHPLTTMLYETGNQLRKKTAKTQIYGD